MDISTSFIQKKARFTLAFFCFISLISSQVYCSQLNSKVLYKDNEAIAVLFAAPKNIKAISVHLANNNISVIGELKHINNQYTFTPIVPFSHGKTYRISSSGQVFSTFTVQERKKGSPPELLTVYPTENTVPENMLKMYFSFSAPMQEVGSSLDFIKVYNKSTNKEIDIFLALEPELWNKNHTILTLWLDPGRIKTGLIPNQEKGLPIVEGSEYRIHVSKRWRDAHGVELLRDYTKNLHVVRRDAKSPVLSDWNVAVQTLGASHLIIIDFGEPLDAILAQETIKILNIKNEKIVGKFTLKNNEKTIVFESSKLLGKGKYKVLVESRLEDLSGNNLNHLFDVNLENNLAVEPFRTKSLFFLVK